MRVTLTKLRAQGRRIPADRRKPLRGEIYTTRVKGGKALVFEPTYSDMNERQLLYEAKVKLCPKGSSIAVWTGSMQENGAWVVQEWEIDFNPVGSGWLKAEPRYREGARIR